MSDFHSVPIDKIWYNKPERQRQAMGSIVELAESMKRIGRLIHPISIDREFQLIAGERRFLAAKSLGWTHITVHFWDELSEEDRTAIEFEENAKRLDLTWQERTLAVFKFYQLKQRLEPKYTQEKLASDLGLWSSEVESQLRVARALNEGDQAVSAAPVFSTAVGILERKDARKRDSDLEDLNNALDGNKPIPATIRIKDDGDVHFEEVLEGPPCPVTQGDFSRWAASYTGPKFNFIHCDFPYGIEADNHDQGAAKSFGGYADSEEIYWQLMGVFIDEQKRFVADSAHMLFWFSLKYYEPTRAGLQNAGWQVNPTPLIWHRSDNSGILPDPRRMPRQVYETAFLCSRGDRFLVKPRSNLFASPNTKAYHMSEKPLPVLEYFLSMLVDEHSVVLDPTAGSGNALIASHRLGAKHLLGLELNPEFAALANDNWRKNYNGQANS